MCLVDDICELALARDLFGSPCVNGTFSAKKVAKAPNPTHLALSDPKVDSLVESEVNNGSVQRLD